MNAAEIYNRSFIISVLFSLALTVSFPRILGFVPAGVSVIGFLAYRPVFGSWPSLSKHAFGWALLFTGLAFISGLWAVNSEFALERAEKLLLILPTGALFISVAQMLGQSAKQLFIKAFPWVLILMGVLLVFDLYSNGMIYGLFHEVSAKEEFYPSKLNRSIIIFVLSLLIAIPLIGYSCDQKQKRIGIFALLFVLTAAIFFKTESQSAQLAIIIGSLFLAFFPYRLKPAWYVLTGLLVAGIMGAPWIAQAMFENLPSLIKGNPWFSEGYAAARMEIWDFVARRALESPAYGFGIEAGKAITDFDTARIYHPSALILHPHNFVLQIWIEFGAVGALIVSGFFGWVFLSLSKLDIKDARLVLPSLVACIALASTTFGIWQSWWLGTFFFLAVFFILSRNERRI